MKNHTATKKGSGRLHVQNLSKRKDKLNSRGVAFPKLFRRAMAKELTIRNP